MAFKFFDRVKETTASITGTGTYSLAGAVANFRGFVAAGYATADTAPYFATAGTDWEVGIGTVTDGSPDTLARTTILSSSNSNAAVSWAGVVVTIAVGWPADRAIMFDRNSLANGDYFKYDSSTGLIVRQSAIETTKALSWVQVVTEDGSSFANFTSVAGTWASSGGVITQTDTGVTGHARYTAQVPTARCYIKAKVKMVTGASGTISRIGFIIGYNGTLAGTSIVYLEGSTTAFTKISVDQAGVTTLATINTTPAYGTFHDFAVDVAGMSGSVYLNGTLMLTYRNESGNAAHRDSRYFGLYTVLSSVQFDDIELWRSRLPGE